MTPVGLDYLILSARIKVRGWKHKGPKKPSILKAKGGNIKVIILALHCRWDEDSPGSSLTKGCKL